ncbi:MAG: alpha/beta hydrolase [Clostridiales bacterium]|nr:alpha/beta hydrolase [Clostridiales bacterium]
MDKVIKRHGGYNIHYEDALNGNPDKVVIVVHGFASSTKSPTSLMLMKNLAKEGIGVIAFDFPAHGESHVDGDMLRIGNCLEDLRAVEKYAKDRCPGAEIYYFGSS